MLGTLLCIPAFRNNIKNPDSLLIMSQHFREGKIVEKDEQQAEALSRKSEKLFRR